ncbi:Putative protein [Zobellia galactanivorans]|uniref:Uncharacterized protein n=1 Tax=Zobellia galactanivorans (strain DSM 12802 / CCUG 47099 / CIP 106680 / NCIMB 13871 / Dsij) TaxID=63186 RepID=G0L409_ZOBGA|nr:Putative protein [Zobellia galactanivorans]
MAQATKVLRLSAIAYNLKKYLKFTEKRSKSGVGNLLCPLCSKRTYLPPWSS